MLGQRMSFVFCIPFLIFEVLKGNERENMGEEKGHGGVCVMRGWITVDGDGVGEDGQVLCVQV